MLAVMVTAGSALGDQAWLPGQGARVSVRAISRPMMGSTAAIVRRLVGAERGADKDRGRAPAGWLAIAPSCRAQARSGEIGSATVGVLVSMGCADLPPPSPGC